MMLNDILKEWLFSEFKMKWHYIRYEYQHRGTIHAHILIKLNEEPYMTRILPYSEKVVKEDSLIKLGLLCMKAKMSSAEFE